MPIIVCRPKPLTPEQSERAMRRGLEINPANAAESSTVARTPVGRRGGPRRLALVVGRRWPASGTRLTVQFLDNASSELRARILLHMNAWGKTANVSFEETRGTGTVRIARLDTPQEMAGYWSYVGTEILGIDEDEPTMNLEGFTMRTSEAEFRRVVRHEAGHTLGFDHEHMRAALVKKIDRRKAIAYYDRTEGWTAEETIEQVLTPLSARSIMGTVESDPLSIMCYQIPAAITKDGKAIPGGRDINSKDYAFAGKVYPKPARDQAAAAQPPAALQPAPMPPMNAGESALPAPDETFHIVIMDAFSPEAVPAGRASGRAASAARRRPRFARVFASYGGARVTGAMRIGAGKGEAPTRFGSIIRMHERIKSYTNRERGVLPSDEQMVAFGTDLFETLFQGDVRRLYDEARARQRQRKLDFVLTSMIPWIAEKPWEFAYDAARASFLATEEIHFVRNVLTAVPADLIAPRAGPLRMLVAAAQPVGFGRLSVEQEVSVIRRGFEPLIEAGLAAVEVLARATPGRIHGMLSTQDFDVVHFIGHGTYDDDAQEGSLIFEDERGGQYPLGERSVREILCQRGVRLVFLNACQTATGGRAEFNKGVAQALVSHGLPALVANQYSVLDSSATSFAQHFYWALAQGMSLGEAAREARIAVNYSMQGELVDWAVPVVYARDPNMALCARPGKSSPAPAISVRRASRRAIKGRAVRVAVWDMDNVFPSLERTLEGMNSAQSVFGFELVDLSAPIDAWDLEQRADDGTPYLWAEKLARRLERAAADLRVDILACVTRHWLRDDNTRNLYGWWPDGGKPPVVIFSCAGIDELPPEGPETDRVIANVTVSALAGFLADMDSHVRGAKDCPMAFNPQRDYAVMAGAQKFDRSCHAKLKKKIPNELAALEALLRAFQSHPTVKIGG
jgi:hypothetical protein